MTNNVVISDPAPVAVSGPQPIFGTFTLVDGLATVSNAATVAGSIIMPTLKTESGIRGGIPDCVPMPGVGFTATAAESDESTYSYVMFNPTT